MTVNALEYRQELLGLMKELGGQIPTVLQTFHQVHKAALTPGALDTKTKELIALSIAISKQCQGCIVFHVGDCLKAGANEKEIAEAIGVAVMMGGGPAVMYGCEALSALKQLKSA